MDIFGSQDYDTTTANGQVIIDKFIPAQLHKVNILQSKTDKIGGSTKKSRKTGPRTGDMSNSTICAQPHSKANRLKVCS
jgi:hypothetical protein